MPTRTKRIIARYFVYDKKIIGCLVPPREKCTGGSSNHRGGSRTMKYTVVTLKMDYRDVSNPHGIPAIVFALSTNELGRGIQAVTDHGIICSGKGRNEKI